MGFKGRIPTLSTWGTPFLLTVTCVFLQALERTRGHWIVYEARGIRAGEYWRRVTGNLLHLDYAHLLLNLAGLWLAVLLFPSLRAGTLRYFALTMGTLAVGLGLLWFSPAVEWYVG